MVVLAAMVFTALDMVIRVSFAFWARAAANEFLLNNTAGGSLTSQPMQQGGMGLILTTLILMAPPMEALFFQGTLGTFAAFSQIAGPSAANRQGPQGQLPGSYNPRAPSRSGSGGTDTSTSRATMPIVSSGAPSPDPSNHKFGVARWNKG